MLTEDVAQRLAVLEEDDQETMIGRYCDVYGDKCLKQINTGRNGLQSKIRKVHIGLLKDKKAFNSKQLFHVAQRQNLIFYDENDENEAKAADNKAKNLQNQKYRHRSDLYVDPYMPALNKEWTVEKRCLTTVSGGDENNPPLLTWSDEAMIVLLVENAEEKWNHENTFLLAGDKIPGPSETQKWFCFRMTKLETTSLAAGVHLGAIGTTRSGPKSRRAVPMKIHQTARTSAASVFMSSTTWTRS